MTDESHDSGHEPAPSAEPVPETTATTSVIASEPGGHAAAAGLIVAPSDGCPHQDWELRWSHPKTKRKVEDCTVCGVRRFTDGSDQTIGAADSHAPWVTEEHRKAFEKSRRPE